MSPRDFNHLQQHFLFQDSTSTKINNLSKLRPSSPKRNYASFITQSTTIQIPLCTLIICGKGTTHITTHIYFYLVTSNDYNIIIGLSYSTSIFYRSDKQGPIEDYLYLFTMDIFSSMTSIHFFHFNLFFS